MDSKKDPQGGTRGATENLEDVKNVYNYLLYKLLY